MSHYWYYILTLGVYFFVYCLLGLGYNLQYGLAGIHNVANFIFVAFGAYITAVLTLGPSNSLVQSYIFGTSISWPLPLLIGAASGAVMSLVLGFIFLWRLKFQYQAIVTLVVAQVIWLLVGNSQGLFNGFNGLAGVPQPLETVVNLAPVPYEAFFVGVAGFCALLGFAFMRRVVRSPLGRVLRSIREDESVASGFGRNVFRQQMVAFMVAGAMAGLAGGLLVEYLGSWTPSGWTVSEGFVVISALIIGGTANNIGAALGAFIVPVVIYELTAFIPPFGPVNSQTIDAFRWIAIGVIALLFLWFRPQGVLPEPRRHFRLVDRILAGHDPMPNGGQYLTNALQAFEVTNETKDSAQ
jgi:ABC-type branched-subunit amino acid transport system permease subunit